MFSEKIGFELNTTSGKGFLQRAIINSSDFKNNGYEWLFLYLSEWNNVHSTLKQSFINGYVNAVLIPEYGEDRFESNNDNSGISFPFI